MEKKKKVYTVYFCNKDSEFTDMAIYRVFDNIQVALDFMYALKKQMLFGNRLVKYDEQIKDDSITVEMKFVSPSDMRYKGHESDFTYFRMDTTEINNEYNVKDILTDFFGTIY